MPLITLNGTSSVVLQCGELYTEQNATATDAEDGTLRVTTSGRVDTSTAGSYTITYSATDSDGNRATKSRTIRVTSITHNGTSYCTVTSPYTSRVWLDRNLGAARVCTSFNDTACYGDYYQWGRNFDGHEDSGSATTTTLATDVDDVGHGEFIMFSLDWASVDGTGIVRATNWSKTNGTSVCPIGFRVPTLMELKIETLDNGVVNITTAIANFLKLPAAGDRYSGGPLVQNMPLSSNLWTTSVNNNSTSVVAIFDDRVFFSATLYRSRGYPVRCIKN